MFVLNPILNIAIAGILMHVVQNPYRILHFAPVVWLGQISYSLYLWQQPFMNPSSPVPYGVFAALGMACCSFYLIERPLLRYRDRQQPALPAIRTEPAAA